MAKRTVFLFLVLLTVRGAGWAGQVQAVVNHPLEPEELVDGFEIASDGRYVMYKVLPSVAFGMWPITRLWAAPLDRSTGRTAWPLSTLPYACVYSAHITPDGARAVYRADQDHLDVVELYSIPIEGGTPVKLNDALTTGGNVVGEPSSDILDPFDPRRGPGFRIAPDSQRVVYQADATTDSLLELFVVPGGGGPVTRLSGPMPPGGGLQSDGFRISPDGTRVVYLAAQDTADGIDLYSVPIGGGAPTRLSAEPLIHPYDYPDPLSVEWPSFEITTDSTHVVYWADPDSDGVHQWWRVPIEGSEAPVATTKPASPGGGDRLPRAGGIFPCEWSRADAQRRVGTGDAETRWRTPSRPVAGVARWSLRQKDQRRRGRMGRHSELRTHARWQHGALRRLGPRDQSARTLQKFQSQRRRRGALGADEIRSLPLIMAAFSFSKSYRPLPAWGTGILVMLCAISAAAGSPANKARMFRGASQIEEINISGNSGVRPTVTCFDFDGDGKIDILQQAYSLDVEKSEVVLYRNTQSGLSSPPSFEHFTLVQYPHDWFMVCPGDVDRDGDLDLVSSVVHSLPSGTQPLHYINQGGMPPTFAASSAVTSTATQRGLGLSVACGDLDGDGDPDAISCVGTAPSPLQLAWWQNDVAAAGQFIARTAGGSRPSYCLATTDLNNDGRLDFLSLAPASSEDSYLVRYAAYWYRNEGGSPPASGEYFIDYTIPSAPIFSSDIDGDGDQDVFFQANSYYENDGATSPTFTARTYAPQYGKHYIKPWLAADLDGDGDLDLVASPLSTTGNPTGLPTGLAWFENNGARPPSFTDHKIFVADFDYRSVAAADLDGDADIDLVALTATEVYWLENDPIRNAVGAAQWTLME